MFDLDTWDWVLHAVVVGIGGRVKGPCWDLQRLKELAAAGRIWLMRGSAFEPAAQAFDIDDPVAIVEKVTAAIGILEDLDFAHSLDQVSTKMDVYGLVFEQCGWYVKVYIDEDVEGGETTVVSFHPPTRDLVTRRRRIRAGGQLPVTGEQEGAKAPDEVEQETSDDA